MNDTNTRSPSYTTSWDVTLVPGSADGAASALGSTYSRSASAEDATKALVRAFNKGGGLAGRQVKAVTYVVPATSQSYQVELQAACAKFTQDNHAAAVLSLLANTYYANYEQCLSKAGVPDLAGTTGTIDDQDLAAFPGLVSVTAPSTNRRFGEMLGRFGTDGYLTRKSVLGVIVEDCPYNRRAFRKTIAPQAAKLGVTLVSREIGCITGFGDVGAAVQGVGAAVLPFRSAGVDRVAFVSNFEGVALLAFENSAHSQGYAPGYTLTSTTGGASLADQFDDDQLRRMRGVGWTPVFDVTARKQASPTTRRCHAMLASEGVTLKTKADDLLDVLCDQFLLLEATLQNSGGRAAMPDLLQGLHSLGRNYTSAYSLGGATDYTSRREGPSRFALWGFSSACSCMDYVSSPR